MNGKWASLSFPRSGATWIRYVVHFCNNKPLDPQHANNFIDTAFYAKVHIIKPKQDESLDGLLVLVRNYKECITRHCHKFAPHFNFDKCLTEKHWPSYVHPLLMYEKFERKKLLIYYEDLITQPVDTLMKIGEAMDINVGMILSAYEHHRLNSLATYVEHKPGLTTAGKKVNHHAAKLGREKALAWDEQFKNKLPVLWDKYLSRYEGYALVDKV
jgi:hypothetical protein